MSLNITRKSYWTVITHDDVFVSQHSEEKEAYESAANYSFANGGIPVHVKGASFEVTSIPNDVPVIPKPSSSSDAPEPTPEPSSSSDAPEPTPEPTGQTLVPGNGWSGDLPTPTQIGTSDEKAITRWDVVPYQIINEPMTIGVCAAHVDALGINRVEFSVDNGPWVSVTEEKYNERTKVTEYYAIIDPAQFTEDKAVTVRAVAYPNRGVPTVLVDMPLNVNPNGTLEHDYLYLDAGTHKSETYNAPMDRWLIVKPKPGVAKEDVVMVHGKTDWGIVRPGNGNVKFEGLTWDLAGSGYWWYSLNGKTNNVWADDVEFLGNPKLYILHRDVNGAFYTDCKIGSCQALFDKPPSQFGMLVRNLYVPHVYEDFIRGTGCYLNIVVDEIDRREYTSYHHDFLQSQWYHGGYMRNVTVKNNTGQGIFPADFGNSAFINVRFEKKGVPHQLQMMGKTYNVLFKDCYFTGTSTLARYDKGFRIPDGQRVVFDGTPVADAIRDDASFEVRNEPAI